MTPLTSPCSCLRGRSAPGSLPQPAVLIPSVPRLSQHPAPQAHGTSATDLEVTSAVPATFLPTFLPMNPKQSACHSSHHLLFPPCSLSTLLYTPPSSPSLAPSSTCTRDGHRWRDNELLPPCRSLFSPRGEPQDFSDHLCPRPPHSGACNCPRVPSAATLTLALLTVVDAGLNLTSPHCLVLPGQAFPLACIKDLFSLSMQCIHILK